MRVEEAGEHLRGETPVRADEVDERAPGRLRDVAPARVGAEEHDPPHPLGRRGRERGGGDAGARAREQGGRAASARLEHRPEHAHVGLDARSDPGLALGEPHAEPVVAGDAVGPGELLVEAPRPRVLPLLFEMGDPAPAEEEQRPLADGRVRDPLAVERAEADVLLHGPTSVMARTGHVKKMARRGDAGAEAPGPP
jgi:hypothetical protein